MPENSSDRLSDDDLAFLDAIIEGGTSAREQMGSSMRDWLIEGFNQEGTRAAEVDAILGRAFEAKREAAESRERER
jgi:hypothetical protein